MPVNTITRSLLQECGFFDTRLARRLRADPVGLVDAGARWGISEQFAVAAPLFSALAFEPDTEEAVRVEEHGKGVDWARFRVEAKALGRDHGAFDLHLYARANNSSKFPVSPTAMDRYGLVGFELQKIVSVPTNPLDAVIFDPSMPPRAGEVVKLDTQGMELDILQGAARTLTERTVCLIAEAHLYSLYAGAPFFADLDQLLRAAGFTFIAFSDFQHRSSKRLDKRNHWSRERFFQADALYFRDPLSGPQPAPPRVVDVAILMAVLLGFFDLALEWAAAAERNGVPSGDVMATIEKLSRLEPSTAERDAAELLGAIRRNPELGHVLIGKFIDERRDLPTFNDVRLPEPGA